MRSDKVKEIFDQHASRYDKQWAKTAPIRDGLHFLLNAVFAELPTHDHVLCVGAGTGEEIACLAKVKFFRPAPPEEREIAGCSGRESDWDSVPMLMVRSCSGFNRNQECAIMETEIERVKRFFKSVFLILKYFVLANVSAMVLFAVGVNIIDSKSRKSVSIGFHLMYIIMFGIFSIIFYRLNVSSLRNNYIKSQRIFIGIVFIALLGPVYLFYIFVFLMAFNS